jgi:hypothetical protein
MLRNTVSRTNASAQSSRFLSEKSSVICRVARGAPELGEVGDRDINVDVVAKLGGQPERRGAAGRAVELEVRELGVFGLRDEPPDLAAPGDQRELREQLCRRH